MDIAYQQKAGDGTMRHYVGQLEIGFEWKYPLSILATFVSIVDGFYSNMVWGFIALFALDLITGIMKSVKNGIPISSQRLRDSVTKLGAYMLLITSLIVASKYEPSFVSIVTCTYYYFIFTELKSIFENVESMGVKIPKFLSNQVRDRVKDDEEDDKRD